MGQCYGKHVPVAGDGDGGSPTEAAADPARTPAANNGAAVAGRGTPGQPPSYASSPWRSPLPPGIAPSPARSTPGRRFFRRPFPPPSPAKHISMLKRRWRQQQPPKEGPIPEDGEAEAAERTPLDKRFGYGENFGAKYELGREVGRGHFGHTCSARAKKGEIKGQQVAVKIISKDKFPK